MPLEQCPEREETGYNNVEEVTFQFDDLPPQLENELEYVAGSGNVGSCQTGNSSTGNVLALQ